MKKIVCFTISLGSGGAERQLISLASCLKEAGHEVSLLTYCSDLFYKDYLEQIGLKNNCYDKYSSNFTRFIACWRYIRKVKADVVISYLEMPSFMTCLMKMFGGRFNLIVSERNTTQRKTWFDKMRFPLMRFANHIVPNSHSQEAFIKKEYPYLKKKITTISNFVDTETFSPLSNKQIGERVVLTVARINPQKNIIRYIEAISKIKETYNNVTFKWYGSITDEEYYNRCVLIIKERGLENTFIFEKPTENIVEAYRSASIFCLPSLFEGYPNVICEAMSCGLPILCGNVCDNALIVENEVNGILFDPLSIESICASLDQMLQFGKEELISKGSKSREIAINKFSKIEFVNQYMNLI